MDVMNIVELKKQIIECESLLPGDKISYDRLLEISQKYKIAPRILAINIFGVTQAAYRGLVGKSSNAKNIIIFKSEIPKMIEDAIALRDTILSKEKLVACDKINYIKLQQIAPKYNMRENILAIYVFKIPENSFREIRRNPKAYAIILSKDNNSSEEREDNTIEILRKHILKEFHLKPLDKINYNMLITISNKVGIEEKKLAMDIFKLSINAYNKIKYYPNRNSIILPNYYSNEKLNQLKNEIVQAEGYEPFDEINYSMLQQISNKYNVNEKVLAIDILGITSNQYYNIKVNPKMMACILKADYKAKTPQELKTIKDMIFKEEKLSEGYRISLSEIEMLQNKYRLSLKELLYILGVTHDAYNFIKSNPYYKTIIKDTEVLLISQVLNETLKRGRYYLKEEIEKICEENNISQQNFFDYILGKARFFGFEEYKRVLDEKGQLWIGDKEEISEEFKNTRGQNNTTYCKCSW